MSCRNLRKLEDVVILYSLYEDTPIYYEAAKTMKPEVIHQNLCLPYTISSLLPLKME